MKEIIEKIIEELQGLYLQLERECCQDNVAHAIMKVQIAATKLPAHLSEIAGEPVVTFPKTDRVNWFLDNIMRHLDKEEVEILSGKLSRRTGVGQTWEAVKEKVLTTIDNETDGMPKISKDIAREVASNVVDFISRMNVPLSPVKQVNWDEVIEKTLSEVDGNMIWSSYAAEYAQCIFNHLKDNYTLYPSPVEKWIKVEDVEPQPKTKYWLYGEFQTFMGGPYVGVSSKPYYWKEGEWVEKLSGGTLVANVTHYMLYEEPKGPLPTHPHQ